MRETIAAAVGFFVAPMVCAVMFAALGLLTGQGSIHDLAGLSLVGYVFSLAAMLVFGVPAFLLLRFLKLIYWWTAVAGGFSIGAVVGIAIVWPGLGQLPFKDWMDGTVHNLLIMGIMGATSAFVFWLIWKQGRSSTRTN